MTDGKPTDWNFRPDWGYPPSRTVPKGAYDDFCKVVEEACGYDPNPLRGMGGKTKAELLRCFIDGEPVLVIPDDYPAKEVSDP